MTVRDDDCGIPADIRPIHGVSAAEIIMTRLHGSVKFEPTAHEMFRARHGVGVSVVNALSEVLDLRIWRLGKEHYMPFRLGDPRSAVVGNADLLGGKPRAWNRDHLPSMVQDLH